MNQSEQERKFIKLLQAIAARPAMYVVKCSIRDVSLVLMGYELALGALEIDPLPLDGWARWVESRFLISHPAWHWSRILLHAYGSETAAVAALPGLYVDFLSRRSEIGVSGIERELRERLNEAYSRNWYAPEATHTRDP